MRDVLLIDTRNRTLRHRAGKDTLFAREYNIFVADSSEKAMDMLKTAVMDAVVINLSGPEEDATEIVEQITREHPRLEIVFLSASEVDRVMDGQFKHRGLIQYLREYLRNVEQQHGTIPVNWQRYQSERWLKKESICLN